MSRYLSVKLPEDYKTKFERMNESHSLGYSSFPEFIKHCLRIRFKEISEDTETDESSS